MRTMKNLARELGIVMVVVSQLNRSVESRTVKKPQLSDLRDSGSVEEDADVVLFIYRDEYYNCDSDLKNVAEVIVAKHRHGPTGSVSLFFDKDISRFRNLSLEPGN